MDAHPLTAGGSGRIPEGPVSLHSCTGVPLVAALVSWIGVAAVLVCWLAAFNFRVSILLSSKEAGGWVDLQPVSGVADVALLMVYQAVAVSAVASDLLQGVRWRSCVVAFTVANFVWMVVKIVVQSVGLSHDKRSQKRLWLLGTISAAALVSFVTIILAWSLRKGAKTRQGRLQERGSDAERPCHNCHFFGLRISPWSNWRRELWLLISSFGVVFAFLSWLQDTNLLDNSFLCPHEADELCARRQPWVKFWFAVCIGMLLWIFIAREHDVKGDVESREQPDDFEPRATM